MSRYNEIKNILLEAKQVSDIQFNRLVDVYGERLVNRVIRDLVNNDDSMLIILEKYISDFYLDDSMISSYDYYKADISSISNISLDDKKSLIIDIFNIVSMLNKLFELVGDITRLDDERKKPWISDKVEYCLSKCDDKDLLDKIKVLYDEYVFKRNILVQVNLKFVIMIARSFYSKDSEIEFEDLIQYGNIGLIRAVETYNPRNNTEFTTYASYWIKQSIIFNSRKMNYQMKIPKYIFELNNKKIDAIDILTNDLGRYPTDKEIADFMGISLEKLGKVVSTFANPLSLDEFSGIYLDGMEVLWEEFVPDNTVDVEKSVMLEDLFVKIREYMDMYLNERQIFVLRNIYGFDNQMSTRELANVLGISSQRVSMIKDDAIGKLLMRPKVREMKLYLR